MDHTANILEPNESLIPSLLNLFSMFQLRIFYYKHNKEENALGDIASKCRNCNKENGLYLKDTIIEEIITTFVLNAILYHVGMS